MDHQTAARIIQSPEFKTLITARRRLVVPLILIMLFSYYGFILLIAFFPSVLGAKVGSGVMTVGIYGGLALLVLSIAVSAIFLRLSEGKIHELQKRVVNTSK